MLSRTAGKTGNVEPVTKFAKFFPGSTGKTLQFFPGSTGKMLNIFFPHRLKKCL